MKQAFITKKFNKKTRELLESIKVVVEDYAEQGYKLTLRQLYYQLVQANLIPNEDKWYAKISKVLTDARMCGEVDWDIIEDRVRVPKISSEWVDASDLMESAIHSFRLPRHEDQEFHIELWTEKDALTGIIQPIAKEYHIPLVVNRGYSSASAMYRASKRLIWAQQEEKTNVILYLGDHDPSGLDMDRDILDRMDIFLAPVAVVRIALTMDQVDEYSPPPNPAKISDPRADWYIKEHGNTSWEVDALRPPVLEALLREKIERYMDMEKYQAMIDKERRIKDKLREAASFIDDEE